MGSPGNLFKNNNWVQLGFPALCESFSNGGRVGV